MDLIEEFNRNGYVVLPNAVPKERIEEIFRQLNALMDETIRNQDADPSRFATTDQKFLYLKEHHPKMKSHAYDLMKHLDAVQALANQAEIIALLRELARTPVLVDHVLIRMDDSSNDRMRPLHQEGLGQISYESFNLWVPLVDVNANTGTMRFIPKSHLEGYVSHRFYEEFNNYHGVCEEAVKPGMKEELACLKKGDALIFHPCLFHGTAPMKVHKYMRWTLIARYNSLKEIPYLKSELAPMHIPQNDDRIFKTKT